MKTAIEVLFETTNGDADYISVNNCLEAMKEYASQALDLAAEKADLEYSKIKRNFLGLRKQIQPNPDTLCHFNLVIVQASVVTILPQMGREV